MENAADALKMAAAVLVFVLALSISINAFGQARKTAKTILEYKDREYDYTYINDGEGTSESNNRIVSAETIIPSIYKAYKENYKIVFDFIDRKPLYKITKNDGTEINKFSIDLANESHASDEAKEKFLLVLLFGANKVLENDAQKKAFSNQYEIKPEDLNFEPIYDRIVNSKNKFIEHIGVYYEDEISGSTDAPNVNNPKKRVITYEERNK